MAARYAPVELPSAVYVVLLHVGTGASGKGVSVYLHADLLLKFAETYNTVDVFWIVIYKVRLIDIHSYLLQWLRGLGLSELQCSEPG